MNSPVSASGEQIDSSKLPQEKEVTAPPTLYSVPLGSNDIEISVTAAFVQQLARSRGIDPSWQTSHEWAWPGTGHSNQTPSQSPIKGLSLEYFDDSHQLYLLKLLNLTGITAHESRLNTIIDMTQRIGSLDQTEEQVRQSQNWCRKEGDDVKETYAAHNSAQKGKFVKILNHMNFYNALRITDTTKLDHTLFLGGSVQEMQWRMLTLLSVFDNYGENGEINLGELVALTCDRHIDTTTEALDSTEIKNTFFSIQSNFGQPLVETGPGTTVYLQDLTEDTAYRAIHYSLERMCRDTEYFQERRETSTGYHPPGYLSEESPEQRYYHQKNDTFVLTDEFREAACRFTDKHKINTVSVPEKYQGTNKAKRPTTKRTVLDWAAPPPDKERPCHTKEHCRVLAVSSQPNARYQQMAVYQGLLDTLQAEGIDNGLLPKVTVHLAAAGTSTRIPTDAILNNLTRHLYLIGKHPVD